jgi:hypothetical protein
MPHCLSLIMVGSATISVGSDVGNILFRNDRYLITIGNKTIWRT